MGGVVVMCCGVDVDDERCVGSDGDRCGVDGDVVVIRCGVDSGDGDVVLMW